MSAFETPPAFSAVKVKSEAAANTVGTPDTTPVAGSSDRPSGSDGDTENERMAPPTAVGGPNEQARPMVHARLLDGYASPAGGRWRTSMDNVVEADPAEFATRTSKSLRAAGTLAVPEIAPLEGSSASPSGRPGDTLKVPRPPRTVGALAEHESPTKQLRFALE